MRDTLTSYNVFEWKEYKFQDAIIETLYCSISVTLKTKGSSVKPQSTKLLLSTVGPLTTFSKGGGGGIMVIEIKVN